MNTEHVKLVVPSWEKENPDIDEKEGFSIYLSGVTENADGGTYIKKNYAPKSSMDYDVKCDANGKLSVEIPLVNVLRVYVWGSGYVVDDSYNDCAPVYTDADEIEISNDTEIVLCGVKSE